jgi:hypothetical protein
MLQRSLYVQAESALEALRLMCMAGAISYMVHASILELFASPTDGMVQALSLGVRVEKELYISQVRRSKYSLQCTLRRHMCVWV